MHHCHTWHCNLSLRLHPRVTSRYGPHYDLPASASIAPRTGAPHAAPHCNDSAVCRTLGVFDRPHIHMATCEPQALDRLTDEPNLITST